MNGGIIIYDGICTLCSRSVRFVVAHDQEKYFKFITLQSPAAQEFIKSHHLRGNSIIVVDKGKIYEQSDAILKICKHLRGAAKYISYLKFIPKRIRDGVYKIVAKYRYQWFGKLQVCEIPSEEIRARLLND